MRVFLLGDKSIKKLTMIKLFCGILVLHLLTESVGWTEFVWICEKSTGAVVSNFFNNAPYVTNDETVIWVHIWQSARKQNFNHAFSKRPNHIESIVKVFSKQSRTMSLVILQSSFVFHMKQKNRLESNISVVFSKGDRIG